MSPGDPLPPHISSNLIFDLPSSVARTVQLAALAGFLILLCSPLVDAAPLAINQGGTGNTFGLPSQYAIIKNTATGTTANTLTKYVYSYAPFATKAQVAARTDTSIVGVCVANCGGSGTFASATIQTGGYADCVFDGATTVGDFVQISSSIAGDCTDVGATSPP